MTVKVNTGCVEDEVVVGHIETHQYYNRDGGRGRVAYRRGDVRVCVYKEGSWERTRPPCALRLATKKLDREHEREQDVT